MAKPKVNDYLYDSLRILEVVWVDAQEVGTVGWNDLDDILTEASKPCPIMHSVGYLVHEDEDQINLISTVGPSECSSLEKIPRGWVKRENVLREGKSLKEFSENL